MRPGVRCSSPFVALICLALRSSGSLAATDSEQLRSLHEQVMRAHRESNIDLLLEHDAPDFALGNRGEISRPSLAERRARLGSYLRSTRFEEYRDVSEPVVTVSKDGTLGWVMAQVHVRGVQLTLAGRKEPVEFDSAWIELYEKRGGKWYSVGNVSNFKEEGKR